MRYLAHGKDGIANQVHQHLSHLVAVQVQHGRKVVLQSDFNPMSLQFVVIEPNGFLNQITEFNLLATVNSTSHGLLFSNCISDVTDGFVQPCHLFEVVPAFLLQCVVQICEIINQPVATRIIPKELRQIAGLI